MMVPPRPQRDERAHPVRSGFGSMGSATSSHATGGAPVRHVFVVMGGSHVPSGQTFERVRGIPPGVHEPCLR